MTVKNATLKDKSGNTIHPITKGVLVLNNDSENLGGVEAGAQVNTIEGVQVASSDLTPDSSTKKVNIPVASADTYGVIKAEAKTSSDTQEVKIDATTGKLYTAPGGGGTSASVDNETIRENASDELEVFGIIEQNDGVATKVWTGTYAEYVAIPTKDQDTIYNITDDTLPGGTIVPGNGLSYDSTTMVLSANDATSSVKGVMKLYDTVGTNTDGTMTQASINENFINRSNFVPAGTVITVGSTDCDFTDLQSALASLRDKSCTGTVIISLTAGEVFDINNTVLSLTDSLNCSCLTLQGSSNARATINCPGFTFSNLSEVQCVSIRDLNIMNNGDANSVAITANQDSPKIKLSNVSFSNFLRIAAGICYDILCTGTIDVTHNSTGDKAFACWGGHLQIISCTLNISKYTTGIFINSGAWVQVIDSTYSIQSVTNRYSVAKNTFTTGGIVYVNNSVEN